MKNQSQLVEDDKKLIDFGDAKPEQEREEEPIQEAVKQEEPVVALAFEADPFMQLHHGSNVK